MKSYSITIDETTDTEFLQRVAHWQPVASLDEVVARLAEYCNTWKQPPPPTAEELEQALQHQESQGMLGGGPQFPGLRECRFTYYPYGRGREYHTVSIVELGEPVGAGQMKTTIGTQIWYDFDPANGSQQDLPPIKKPVLVQCRTLDPNFPDPVLVGYRKDAAGDPQCPKFIKPGGQGAGQVYRWCDCLPEGFQIPYIALFPPTN